MNKTCVISICIISLFLLPGKPIPAQPPDDFIKFKSSPYLGLEVWAPPDWIRTEDEQKALGLEWKPGYDTNQWDDDVNFALLGGDFLDAQGVDFRQQSADEIPFRSSIVRPTRSG